MKVLLEFYDKIEIRSNGTKKEGGELPVRFLEKQKTKKMKLCLFTAKTSSIFRQYTTLCIISWEFTILTTEPIHLQCWLFTLIGECRGAKNAPKTTFWMGEGGEF